MIFTYDFEGLTLTIMRFGITVGVTWVALTACTSLLPKPPRQTCFPMDALNTSQRTALGVGKGNPILLVRGEKIVCSCFQDSRLAGAGEGDRLAGAGEGDRLAGAGEGDRLAGAGEGDRLAGAGEGDRLAGAGEGDRLAGAGEGDRLVGAGEGDRLAGAGEGDQLAGNSEGAQLSGNFAKLSCSIVPGCTGFQITGYESKEIKVYTRNGLKLVPSACVTW
jgi:hypothetical protein